MENLGSEGTKSRGASCLSVPGVLRKTVTIDTDLDDQEEGKGAARVAKAAFRRSVAKICNAKQLAGLGDRMAFGGGTLILGPGLPRDVRRLAAPDRASVAAVKGEPPPLAAPPPQSHSEGPNRRATRRLLRLADPTSRMEFVMDHPFFRDTSLALRQRLAPQLVRRSSENASEVLEQGAEPLGGMDYLFFTAPDLTTKVEMLFDGRPIAVLSGTAVFGQEVIFGVTETFVFGARVTSGLSSSSGAVWVIPRRVITALLQKEAHHADAEVLRERARNTTASILRKWYTQPMAQIRLRLFENAEHAFKTALVQAVSMRLHSLGSVLRRAGDEGEDSCFCIFRGEASVYIPGETECLAKLSHSSGTSAWAAWWGLLEVLGICSKSPVEVVADTDAIVWYLSQQGLRDLRKQFPMECRLFDKVAKEHTKLLQPTALRVQDTPLFKGLGAKLVKDLASALRAEVFGVGSTIVCEGDETDDLLFLARGRACVRRQHAERGLPGRSVASTERKRGTVPAGTPRSPMLEKVIAHLQEGSFFGEATALGYCAERNATVLCETVCDVRLLPGGTLTELIAKHPGLAARLLDVAHQNGSRLCCEAPNRSAAEDLVALRPMCLSNECMTTLDADLRRLVTVRRQLIAQQGDAATTFYIFVEGTVLVEVDGKCVSEIQAPALLGERAMLQPGRPHRASLRSKGVCCFRTLGAERARQLLECMPLDREKLLRATRESQEDFLAIVAGLKRTKSSSRVAFMEDEGRDDTPAVAAARSLDSSLVRAEGRGRRDSLGPEEGDDGVNFIDGRPTTIFLSRFFKESEQGFLAFILQGMHKVIFTDQEVIMREGDEGDFAVCIHRGSGTVEIGGVKVGEVKAGSIIGESAVFGEGAKRTATVRAVGLVSAYKLPRALLLDAFQEFPAERKHIEDLARLRGLTNKVLTAPKKEAEEGGASAHHQRRMSRFMDANASIFGSLSRTWGKRGSGNALARGSSARTARPSLSRSVTHQAGRATLTTVDRERQHGSVPATARDRRSLAVGVMLPRSPSECSSTSALTASEAEADEAGPSMTKTASLRSCSSMLSEPRGRRHRLPSGSSSRGSETPRENAGGSEVSKQCSDWVRRRRELIQEAPMRRDQRLAKRGEMLPLVPCWQGYKAEGGEERSPAWTQRLRRAEGLYGPPVWREVFGT